MNRLKKLSTQLRGTKLEDRILIINKFLNNGISADERKRFKDFYDESIKALERNKSVTRAENELYNRGYLIFEKGSYCNYSLIHQISCVAKNKARKDSDAPVPIRTPNMEMKERKIRMEHSIPKSYETSRFGIVGYRVQRTRFFRTPKES